MKSLDELNLKEKKIMIFDLDGTLIDSIGVWNMTDQQLIYRYSGILVDLEYIQVDRDNFLNNNTSGDIYSEYMAYLVKKYNLKISDIDKIYDARAEISDNVFKNEVGFKPNVSKLIYKMKDMGYTLALATISTSDQLKIYCCENKKMLSEMNISEVFDLITTKETVKNKKPNPEVYLKIMDYLNVKPEDCLVFEDSYTGVLASNSAGIEVVNVYDKYSDLDRDKINKLTDYRINSYDEFIKLLDKVHKENYVYKK